MPKTTSQLPASLPATTTPCLDTEPDLGNKTHQYCVDKKVLIPPEIRCSINIHLYNGQIVKARLTAITPVIDPIKSFTNLSNKVVTLTWTTATLDTNNNDTFTNWTIKERTLLCEDFAATFIPTSVMLVHSLDQPYLIKDHILNARDISYHMRKLLIHDGKYKSSASAAACYADAIVFLTVGNTRLRQINVTSTEKGLIIPDTTRMTIDFDPTHPLPLEIDTCKSYTVSDKCFDKSDLQDDHCKAKNSVCINVHRQSLQWYLLKTPVSHTYYDTTKTGFGSMNCDMPFPTNINWYKEKLTQRPTARQRQKCMTRAKSLAITITSTISVLSFSFIIKML